MQNTMLKNLLLYISLLKILLASESFEMNEINHQNDDNIQVFGDKGDSIVLNNKFFEMFEERPEVIKKEDDVSITKLSFNDKYLYLIAKLVFSKRNQLKIIGVREFFPILAFLSEYRLKNDFKYKIYLNLINASILNDNIEDNIIYLDRRINSPTNSLSMEKVDFKLWLVFLNEILSLVDAHYEINEDTLKINGFQRNFVLQNMISNSLVIKRIVFDRSIISDEIEMFESDEYYVFKKLLKICFSGMLANPTLKDQISELYITGPIYNNDFDIIKEILSPFKDSIYTIKITNIMFGFSFTSIFTNPGKALVRFIENFTNLEQLDLSFVSPSSSRAFKYILSTEKIKKILSSLIFNNNVEITQSVANCIANLNSLKTLCLYFHKISECSLLTILKSEKLHETLDDLKIVEGELTSEQTELLSCFKRFDKSGVCSNLE